MRQWWLLSILTALVVAGAVFAASEEDPAKRQFSPESGKFVVHEWGVIRISQRDGRALVPADIPEFVARERGAVSVKCIDKPVLYFYSGKERTLDIAVGIPSYDEILSWPPAKAGEYQERAVADKAVDRLRDANARAEDGIFRGNRPVAEAFWEKVVISASKQAVKARKVDAKHWWHASRQVQSSVIKCAGEEEKFLFYESPGLAFDCNMRATILGTGETQLQTNNGDALALAPLLAAWVDGNDGRIFYKENFEITSSGEGGGKPTLLAPKELESSPRASQEWKKSTVTRLQQVLESAGLYTDEATEVAKIWNEEFFQQEGRRIIYFMPSEQIDQLLPLYFSETPDEVVRVMMIMIEY